MDTDVTHEHINDGETQVVLMQVPLRPAGVVLGQEQIGSPAPLSGRPRLEAGGLNH